MAVFDPVLAFVMIQIIGFAVGQHDQQFARTGFSGQLCADVADCGTKAGVMAGVQRADNSEALGRHGVVKGFATRQKHPIAT
jgi:hypothetical protein